MDATTGAVKLGPFSSLLSDNKTLDPGALNVELDIPVAPFGAPGGQGDGGAFVRLWGIPLNWIGQATNLNGLRCQVYAGMSKGLPLANPAQQGLLVDGIIFQAFANWVGTDMTLDLNLIAPVGTIDTPKSHILYWKAGTTLSDAIKQCLTQTYPGYTVNINISENLVLPYDETGFYPTLSEFTNVVSGLATSIISNSGNRAYGGISISLKGKTFTVVDTTNQPSPKQIAFTDFMGQPTWVGLNEIQMYLVMRGDLSISDFIKMPTTPSGQGVLAYTQASSFSALKNQSIFQGTFLITQIRHVGNFRSPQGTNWITTVNAVTLGTNPDEATTE